MRKIIHIDCDCFFAAVELRDKPQLRGLPVAVGGSSRQRGVLATCNYQARQYGLHSAMPTARAMQLCPQLILLPHRFTAYKTASDDIRHILQQYSDCVEPLSLDEAYLDVSGTDNARAVAAAIRRQIASEVGVTASAGVSINKFLAKVASDWQKPNGQFVILPTRVQDFVKQLPVEKIPGVGPAAMSKMQALAISNCEDLQALDKRHLFELFGAFGARLYDLCRGVDERPVCSGHIRKSVSVEQTFDQDLETVSACLAALPDLLQKLELRLADLQEAYCIDRLFAKVRFSDFTSSTAEMKSPLASMDALKPLLLRAWHKKSLPVRLLGVGAGISLQDTRQLDLAL